MFKIGIILSFRFQIITIIRVNTYNFGSVYGPIEEPDVIRHGVSTTKKSPSGPGEWIDDLGSEYSPPIIWTNGKT
jgi:hypothetical protein